MRTCPGCRLGLSGAVGWPKPNAWLDLGMNRMSLLVLLLLLHSGSWSQGPCNNQTSVNYDGYDYAVVELEVNVGSENSKFY